MLGYGNVPMIVQQMDKEFVDRVFIELHNIAGSNAPEILFGALPPDIPVSDFVSRDGYTCSRHIDGDTKDMSSPAFSIHVDSDCGDNVTRWYLRYPDGHFHHVGRTADKFEAVHKALIRAEKDRVTVDSVTFTDESVARYFHAQLDTIAKPQATGDVLRISAVTKLDTPVKADVPVEIEDNNDDDPPPAGGSSPKLSQVILGAFREADSYPGRRFSIALSQPKGHDYQQLTFLVPTAEMLKEWKTKHDIVRYTHRYNAYLSANKTQVLEWIKGLQGDEVLLCWEPYVKANSERERQFCPFLIPLLKSVLEEFEWLATDIAVEVVVEDYVKIVPILAAKYFAVFPVDDVVVQYSGLVNLGAWPGQIPITIHLSLSIEGKDVVLDDVADGVEVENQTSMLHVVYQVILNQYAGGAVVQTDAMAISAVFYQVVTHHRARRYSKEVDHSMCAKNTDTQVMQMIVLHDVVTHTAGRHITPLPADRYGPFETAVDVIVGD